MQNINLQGGSFEKYHPWAFYPWVIFFEAPEACWLIIFCIIIITI